MPSKKLFLILVLHLYQAYTETENHGLYGSGRVEMVGHKAKLPFNKLANPAHDIIVQRQVRTVPLGGQPRFWLYTRDTINNTEELFTPIQNNTNYVPHAPLLVLVHGWLNDRDSDSVQLIKNDILMAANRDNNVIIMDWSDMQSSSYIISAEETSRAAEKLTDFMQSLVKTYQIRGSNIHIIGHSLGAHVAGLAGGKLKNSDFIISRVTGLDPAKPLFELPIAILPGISQDSAAFVDIIHTSIGTLGICNPAGHVDFYPGGGIFQPALCPTTILPGSCEHHTAYIYFQKSLTTKFEARKCHDYFMYEIGLCNNNEMQYMGDPCPNTARGSYFLDIKTI